MKIKWTQNWGLKIGSLVFAGILWLLITNIEDPVDSQRFQNISVRLLNTDTLTRAGKTYEVLEGSDVIKEVIVRAPRSVFNQIGAGNIVATADVSRLNSLDMADIVLSVDGATVAEITGSTNTVKLNIEDEKTESFSIDPTTSGQLADGFVKGDITLDQNYVRLTGPASLIDSVDTVKANTQITQATGDINTEADVVLYDKSGVAITGSRLERIEQNIKVVRVRITVLETKSVPVHYVITGSPAEGYRQTGAVESSHGSISIAGRSNVLADISSIELPEELLDISGSTENFVRSVDINPYLKDGVRLEDETDHIISYTVAIEPEVSETVVLYEDRVRIVNMPEGYEGTFTGIDEQISVTLVGLRNDLETALATVITGEIDVARLMEERDMEAMTEGFYSTAVDLNLGDQIVISEPIEVTLHVTAAEE